MCQNPILKKKLGPIVQRDPSKESARRYKQTVIKLLWKMSENRLPGGKILVGPHKWFPAGALKM